MIKNQPFPLRCSESHFTQDELESLRKFGGQLQSVATNHVPPDINEEPFLRLAQQIQDFYEHGRGRLPGDIPLDFKYKTFLKYWSILARDGNLPPMKRRSITPKKISEMESRATKGGLSTDDQNNRFAH